MTNYYKSDNKKEELLQEFGQWYMRLGGREPTFAEYLDWLRKAFDAGADDK